MRFTITPLGSARGRSVGQVVDDIVRYLEGPQPPSQAPPGRPAPGTDGPSRYYSDGNAEPGRWLGNGAAEMGLTGTVDSADFARVLAGRDPHTGVRLITARGSAGRRPSLGRGAETLRDADGQPLYDLRDASAALELEPSDVERLVVAGQAAAVRSLATLVSGDATAQADSDGSYLVPLIDANGDRWVTESELQRCEAGRAAGPDPDVVAAAGPADETMSVAEAARLAGVSSRYLRSLCARWERDREKIEAARAQGKQPSRSFLVAYRGTKNQWLVKRGDLVEYLRHRTAPAVRVGFDLTLTTEKSLGVLALLGGDRTRAAVLDAIEAGNDRGLDHLEYWAAMARVRGDPVSTRGWTVASFRHLTSRALDPFPHHHNVVANTVVDPDDTRRALDARWLYRHAGEASALATAEMRYRLTNELGVRWRRGRKGGWEIDGIPDDVLREFSRRTNEVDEAVAELEALIGRTTTLAELRGMVKSTRPSKRQVDPNELVADWWRRAEGHRFTPERVAQCANRLAIQTPSIDEREVFQRLAAPDGLCAGGSIFTRSDVVAALVDLDAAAPGHPSRPLLLPADDIERLADNFLSSDLVVELASDRERLATPSSNERIFTTAEMLGVQVRILERFRAGRSVGATMVPTPVLERSLADHSQLTDEQRALVTAFCRSGDRVQCAIGRAGAGKTTAMRAAVVAWEAAGYRVLGAAVKGEAARHLGAEAHVDTETLAWHLAHDPTTTPLDARTVLIVDEASTVSDRDLDRLLWIADATGATIRMIGDPAQHGAVAAGGMFSVLCDEGAQTPELRTSHRVSDPHDRAAADALRDGRIADALGELDAAGHLHVVTNEVDLYLHLLERWWDSRQAGAEHPMVDRRNHTRHQLNRLAHRLLRLAGEVGSDEIVGADGRCFSVGDRVVARVGDRSLHPPGRQRDYVRNGATGVVVALDHDRDAIRVAFDGIGEIDLPRSYFDAVRAEQNRREVGLDHAYAVTSYTVQGATFDESTSRIDENATRSETYVDVTRGRTANHLYVTRGFDPLDGEHLPKAPLLPITTSLAIRLARSGPERAAIAFGADTSNAATRPAGTASAELQDQATEIVIAGDLRSQQVGRMSDSALDPALLAQLPPRSRVPFLAREWDRTVAYLTVFLTRWDATPGGAGEWEWAVGRPLDDASFEHERHRITMAVIDLTVATAKESFRELGRELPEWAADHLACHAARGTCVHDPHELLRLYERIAAYRSEANIDDEPSRSLAEKILGPARDDSVLRMKRRALLDAALPRDLAARQTRARVRA